MDRLVFLADGNGLAFQAVFEACRSGELKAEVVALAVEKRCAALIRAETVGVPIIFHPWGPYKVSRKLRTTYDRDLAVKLWMAQPDLVLIDGWNRELTWGFREMHGDHMLEVSVQGSPPIESNERRRVLDLISSR